MLQTNGLVFELESLVPSLTSPIRREKRLCTLIFLFQEDTLPYFTFLLRFQVPVEQGPTQFSCSALSLCAHHRRTSGVLAITHTTRVTRLRASTKKTT